MSGVPFIEDRAAGTRRGTAQRAVPTISMVRVSGCAPEIRRHWARRFLNQQMSKMGSVQFAQNYLRVKEIFADGRAGICERVDCGGSEEGEMMQSKTRMAAYVFAMITVVLVAIQRLWFKSSMPLAIAIGVCGLTSLVLWIKQSKSSPPAN